MSKHLHLMRRGDVFAWRRRLPRQSTKFDKTETIQLSLRTTERSLACIIARRLTSESDRMFDQMYSRTLPPAEVRAYLTYVITSEHARIQRQRMVEKFDPVRPDLDAINDQATEIVWKHVAKFGLGRSIDARDIEKDLGHAPSVTEAESIDTMLTVTRADLSGAFRTRRIQADFSGVAGRTTQLSTSETLQLKELFA